MKNWGLLLSILIIASGTMAQKSKMLSAFNYRKYGEYDKAVEAIDAAAENPASNTLAKTWYYRGWIYSDIVIMKNPKWQDFEEGALDKAIESFQKTKTLEMKKIDMEEFNEKYKVTGDLAFDKGVGAFNDKDYPNAVKWFTKGAEVKKEFGVIDSLAIYNAALAADNGGMKDQALGLYQQTADIGYGGGDIYLYMTSILEGQGKTDELGALLKKARAQYPNHGGLITAEINYYLGNDKAAEAFGSLSQAIDQDPDNPTLYFARGTIYESKKDIPNAEADYSKAIALDAEYFDAYYNLGALFFNKAVEENNSANEIPPNKPKEYEAKKAQAIETFKKARPHLEKAEQLQPDDFNTLQSLKQLYAFVKDNENYKRVSAKLKN